MNNMRLFNRSSRWVMRTGLSVVLLLLVLIAGSYQPGSANPGSPPGYDKVGQGVLRAILNDGSVRVVIALRQTPGMAAAQQNIPALKNEVASVQSQVLASLSASEFRGKHQYETVPGLAGILRSEHALRKLAANPNVLRIDLDVGGTGLLGGSVPQIGADLRHNQGNTGEGVVVAFLDSGLDTDHPDLSDDLNQEACFGDDDGSIDGVGFCPNGSDRQVGAGAAEDDAGHGTHTSGIVTSGGVVSSQGVAPDANIVAIKVLDDCSFSGCFSYFSEIVAALDYIIANNATLGVDIINMSIGTGAMFNGNCDASTAYNINGAASINTLRANGVIAFASSGNNGSGTQMTSPACLSNVVSVGAVNSTDTVAALTNSNATTDIMAPGISIVSDAIGGGTTGASGTSMASPHAAGCAALLIESGEATTPNQIETRLETSAIQVTDATNNLTFPRIDCNPINMPPIVDAGGPYNGNEGGTVSLNTATASDPNNDPLTLSWSVDTPVCTFSDPTVLNPTITCGDDGSFTVTLTADDGVNLPVSDDASLTIANVAPVVGVSSPGQSLQYSDEITDVTFTATDVELDPLTASTSYDVDGGGFVPGLPLNLALSANGCNAAAGMHTCTWTLSGTAGVPEGVYTVRVTIDDGDGGSASADTVITVSPEDATVSFDENNPIAVQVDTPGGDSPPFSLNVFVEETEPDEPAGSSQPGDIGLAVATMTLVPVGPGASVAVVCVNAGVLGTGYDAVLTATCSFDNVPVNTYYVSVSIGGGYYTGAGEDVVVIVDPSLGFTTGGGWFYWPDTNDRTNFGYTMKYNKKMTNLQGNLLLIRHQENGENYRVKSNMLDGLAIGEVSGFGWASFTGKATYAEPGSPGMSGNHTFIVYVEDYGSPGKDADGFWIEIQDKDGNTVTLSMTRPAVNNTVLLSGGNIVVPHERDVSK